MGVWKSIAVFAVLAVMAIAACGEAIEPEIGLSRALLGRCRRPCGEGCDKCRCGKCKRCYDGWHREDGHCMRACTQCSEFCINCACDGQCHACTSGYGLYDGICQESNNILVKRPVKVKEVPVVIDGPGYTSGGSNTAEAQATADCVGPNCSTHTTTTTITGPFGTTFSNAQSFSTNG